MEARMMGAVNSKGPALIFMDAHMEVTPGWLEPLLDRLAVNRNITAISVVHPLNSDTFVLDYVHEGDDIEVTGFDWRLNFDWKAMTENERKRRKTPEDPVASPTMLGAFFGIVLMKL
jgi:polypeptide N-acetylgalactosaminyltransferase